MFSLRCTGIRRTFSSTILNLLVITAVMLVIKTIIIEKTKRKKKKTKEKEKEKRMIRINIQHSEGRGSGMSIKETLMIPPPAALIVKKLRILGHWSLWKKLGKWIKKLARDLIFPKI